MTRVALSAVTKWLSAQIEAGNRDLAAFKRNFEENPTYALTWADEAFHASARVEVATAVKALVDRGGEVEDTLAALRAWTSRQVRYRAQAMKNRSTSSSSNRMDECLLAVWAELHERVNPDC